MRTRNIEVISIAETYRGTRVRWTNILSHHRFDGLNCTARDTSPSVAQRRRVVAVVVAVDVATGVAAQVAVPVAMLMVIIVVTTKLILLLPPETARQVQT